MPGIPPRQKPHQGSRYPSQIVGQKAREARRLHDLSQETVAERMESQGHETWTRQTVAQVEIARRNLTVDELVSLAAALQTMISYLLSPASPIDPHSDQPVDIGLPAPLDRDALRGLYGFKMNPYPQAATYYKWDDEQLIVAHGWPGMIVGAPQQDTGGRQQ